jgi:hypothetical protein
VEEIIKTLDLAFLYAEPIVEKSYKGELKRCDVPLDLDEEYNILIEELRKTNKKTNKKFCIMKEAVNHESLKKVINLSPKIIHISCHGAPDK